MRSLAEELREASDAGSRFACIARLARERGLEPIGYEGREIVEAAGRLGIALPPPVRGWYETFARTRGIAFGQNHVIEPAHWELVGGGLVIAMENQGNWRVVVELEGPDPPVRVVGWREGDLSAAFSRYALQTALFESVMCSPGGGCNGSSDGDPTGWLERTFGAPVIEPWLDVGPGPATFWAGAPGIAFLQPDPLGMHWVFIGLVDDEAVRREIERSAPVDDWVVAPTDRA